MKPISELTRKYTVQGSWRPTKTLEALDATDAVDRYIVTFNGTSDTFANDIGRSFLFTVLVVATQEHIEIRRNILQKPL